jgi:protocatechuate 3,4-dioxygenase beta subunit
MLAFAPFRIPGVIYLLSAVLLIKACSPVSPSPTVTITQPPEPAGATNTPEPSAVPTIPAKVPTEAAIEASGELPLSAQCTAGNATLTPASTEGPYYTPDTPERNSLIEADMAGTPLILVGMVLDSNCQPIPGAWLDFWQTDALGNYDNQGYGLRGHQFSAADGSYRLETILPAAYGTGGGDGRPPHIHVKVQAPGAAILTTQLYFPTAEALNAQDNIFNNALLVDMQTLEDGSIQARFDFVVEAK